MNVIPLLYFIATIVAVVKSSAEADDGSVLTKTQNLFESKHLLRGSGSNNENEKKDEERMLEAGTKRLLQLIEINLDTINFNFFCNDDEISNPPSMSPSSTPLYEEIFVASDGSNGDDFGTSCSISDELVVIGADGADHPNGAAYLLNLDGTEVKKLTPGNDLVDDDFSLSGSNSFGASVSIDEKVVVGSIKGEYVRVFSREGIYERTLLCDDCSEFGNRVATHGNKIVTIGEQDDIEKLFVYATEDGELLKTLEPGSDWISDVAMSEQFIVATSLIDGKTFIYNNTSPDFPKITEINQGGNKVAVSNSRVLIGDGGANYDAGAAWLYTTNGTLVKTLDRQDASIHSNFGENVAINDDRVVVAAPTDSDDDEQGIGYGSVFIYSADTGEFVEKVDGEADVPHFGSSVCASDSHYVIGAQGVDFSTGAAYLFEFSEE